MKIELNEDQQQLILDALDALSDAVENENRATTDSEILEGNSTTIQSVATLYAYIANYKEEN